VRDDGVQRLLRFAAIVALVGLAGACADKYSPYTFKDFPGYKPASPRSLRIRIELPRATSRDDFATSPASLGR